MSYCNTILTVTSQDTYYREIWKSKREKQSPTWPKRRHIWQKGSLFKTDTQPSERLQLVSSLLRILNDFEMMWHLPSDGKIFTNVLYGMSVSNNDYLIASWFFLQEHQHQDNNTTESQKVYSNITSAVKQNTHVASSCGFRRITVQWPR